MTSKIVLPLPFDCKSLIANIADTFLCIYVFLMEIFLYLISFNLCNVRRFFEDLVRSLFFFYELIKILKRRKVIKLFFFYLMQPWMRIYDFIMYLILGRYKIFLNYNKQLFRLQRENMETYEGSKSFSQKPYSLYSKYRYL